MARFVRIPDSNGDVVLVNTDRVVLVDPPVGTKATCRLWFDEARTDVWIDTRLPFDEVAALLNGGTR